MYNADVGEILKHCNSQIESIAIQIKEEEINKVVLKNTLENLRSVLDYVAKDIVLKLKKIQKNSYINEKVHFPYGQRENHFKDNVKRNFPTLRQDEPKIYKLIESIQPFKSKTNWLVDLCELTNEAKHNNLSVTSEQKSTAVIRPGLSYMEGCTHVSSRYSYVDDVRQDDVDIDGKGDVTVIKHSGTTLIVVNNRILFHGRKLEIVSFLKDCFKNIEAFVNEIGQLLN